MTERLALPHLEISDRVSDFDETVIIMDGHEEETITIECEGSRELAEQIVHLVNSVRELQATQAPYRSEG